MSGSKRRGLTVLAALGAAGLMVWAVGCAADDESAMGASSGPKYPEPGNEAGGGGAAGSTSIDAGSELPPEKEVESAYEFPAATGKYVWVANPLSGRVAYVDAATLEVRTTEAGHGPTWLSAVPGAGTDTAIVINVQSSDATLLRADADGNIDSLELPVAPGSNAWALEAKGDWAIAWGDYRKGEPPPLAMGYQDIAVLRLTAGQESSTRLSVGYRPVAVSFSADATRAYAVTQDGVSVIDLAAAGGPIASKLVALSDDPLEDPGSRDVSVTPDGKLALVRRDGSSEITVVDLEADKRSAVTLSGPVTDLDLSPDGLRAVAVVRDSQEAVILRLPEVAEDPSALTVVKVDDAVIGSVAMAAEAEVAMLYSNAAEQYRITRLEYSTEPPAYRTMKLHAPVLGVFVSRDGTGTILLHDAEALDGGASIPGAFGVLRMAPELPARLQATLAPPTAVAIAPDGQHAVVAEKDDSRKIYGAWLVRMPTQQVDRYELASPPLAVGVLGDVKRAFVAQKHPEGRLTFVDLDTGLARTLTGFELGARVVDGSQAQ